MKTFYLKAVLYASLITSPLSLCGFYYAHVSDGLLTSIHVLEVDPTEHNIAPVKALGVDAQRETVLTLATRYAAVAAVNGGFYHPNGQPNGILKIGSHWYGTPTKPRGAIGWNSGSLNVLIDRIVTNYSLSDIPEGINIEVIPVSDPAYTSSEEWKKLEYIVGGTPVLIKNGEVIKDFSPEQTIQTFLTYKHPRTAVGIKDDGTWVFVVVDGAYEKNTQGMTMKQLAELMLSLGSVEAINLDGGGSSTMVIEGKVVNEPIGNIIENDKCVRKVSDAIMIYSKFQKDN